MLRHAVPLYDNWFSFFLFFVLFFIFFLFWFFFLFCWCLLPFPVFTVKLRFSVAAVILAISLIAIDVCNKALHGWHFVVLLYGQKAWSNAFYLMFHGCLHDCIQQLYFHFSLISVVRRDFSISISENIITSENCFIKSSKFSTKMSLPQDLFLKESTYDNLRVSNSSITVFWDFGNSLLTFILNDSLHYLWLFECRALFDIDKQVRVPTSFICTEWRFINLFRRSSKCSFVISLSTDSCTKCKTSSLPHFLLLRFRVSIEATMGVFKSLPSTT